MMMMMMAVVECSAQDKKLMKYNNGAKFKGKFTNYFVLLGFGFE